MNAPDFSNLESAAAPKLADRNLGYIIGLVLPYLFVGAGLILLLFLVYGGYELMLSKGDPKAIEAGKAKITSAIIGFIIVFISYWLVQIVGKILGIPNTGGAFPTS